jgi:hypothetical protein
MVPATQASMVPVGAVVEAGPKMITQRSGHH